jgi:hypothetical protein
MKCKRAHTHVDFSLVKLLKYFSYDLKDNIKTRAFLFDDIFFLHLYI